MVANWHESASSTRRFVDVAWLLHSSSGFIGFPQSRRAKEIAFIKWSSFRARPSPFHFSKLQNNSAFVTFVPLPPRLLESQLFQSVDQTYRRRGQTDFERSGRKHQSQLGSIWRAISGWGSWSRFQRFRTSWSRVSNRSLVFSFSTCPSQYKTCQRAAWRLRIASCHAFRSLLVG